MGLTYAQAKSLGIGALHPAACPGKSNERALLDLHSPSVASAFVEDGLNKLERSFRDDVLEPAYVRGDLVSYYREPFRMVLAGQTTYRPDFMAVERPIEPFMAPRLVIVEVKGGHFRDDAKVKIKFAAKDFPCFLWLLAFREGRRGWLVKRVDSRGISRDGCNVSWINGG